MSRYDVTKKLNELLHDERIKQPRPIPLTIKTDIMSDQKFSIDNSKAFFEFLQTERNQFAVWAGTQFPPGEGYTDERVQCENILIAFDQAIEQLKKRDQYIQVLTHK